jgi:acyl-CoA thioesterase I
MTQMSAVWSPTWMLALSGPGHRNGAPRRSPVEIVATMGSYVTRTQAAQVSGLRAGPFGRWADGVTAMRGDCMAFAAHWRAHNDRVLDAGGPLWVVLGDSTAQGLGAPGPEGGYVGQVLADLRQRTGQLRTKAV